MQPYVCSRQALPSRPQHEALLKTALFHLDEAKREKRHDPVSALYNVHRAMTCIRNANDAFEAEACGGG